MKIVFINWLVDPATPKNFLMNVFASKLRPSTSGPINYDPSAMQYLYESQDLPATFTALVKSMINYIRQDSDNHTVVNDKKEKYVILFRIREWILTLLVIFIFDGAVFLTIIWHCTEMTQMKFWGTNALPIVALEGKFNNIRW